MRGGPAGHEPLNVCPGDRADRLGSEGGQDVVVEDAPVTSDRSRTLGGVGREPLLGQLGEGNRREPGVYPGAAVAGGALGGLEGFGLFLVSNVREYSRPVPSRMRTS